MKFTALAAALALVAATSPATAAPRAPAPSARALSLTKSPAVRASAKTSDGNRLAGGVLENPYVSLAMAVVAVGGILLVAGAVANDDQPASN